MLTRRTLLPSSSSSDLAVSGRLPGPAGRPAEFPEQDDAGRRQDGRAALSREQAMFSACDPNSTSNGAFDILFPSTKVLLECNVDSKTHVWD